MLFRSEAETSVDRAAVGVSLEEASGAEVSGGGTSGAGTTLVAEATSVEGVDAGVSGKVPWSSSFRRKISTCSQILIIRKCFVNHTL